MGTAHPSCLLNQKFWWDFSRIFLFKSFSAASFGLRGGVVDVNGAEKRPPCKSTENNLDGNWKISFKRQWPLHSAYSKKENYKMFFCGKKGFLQVLLIPEIAVCSERVIWVGINMEKGSSARRDPLTYWVTLMSGKGGLFPGQGGLGKVCWGPSEASLSFSARPFFPPVKSFSPSLQDISLLLPPAKLFCPCEASQNSCPASHTQKPCRSE